MLLPSVFTHRPIREPNDNIYHKLWKLLIYN
jgi:hypothetical protein